jgi:D-alanyl-D-alanine dipeptidase
MGKIPNSTKQLIVVVSKSWNSSTAKLYRFEKVGNNWRKISPAIPVVVGRRGMGVGIGLTKGLQGVTKREGDKRAPAGVFKIPFIFGKQNLGFNYPFYRMDSNYRCVDDINSKYYNKIVNINKTKRDYRSFEKMSLKSGLYDYGLFISHNPKSIKGRGSCIFMHIAKSSGASTVGCTAMKKRDLISVLKWLDKSKNPILIQAPQSQINRLLPKDLKL